MLIIGNKLGAGSSGIVYEANIEGHDSAMAIKRVFVEKRSNFAFSLREVDVMTKLEHQGILSLVSIYKPNKKESWESCSNATLRDDDIALVFNMARGDLLEFRDVVTITEALAMNVITQMLLAVEYLHANGYIHRDIKLGNILFFEDMKIQLCDFGICKKYFTHDRHSLVGSPLYTAPEVMVEYPEYDYTADIWSIGCVIHYIMSGKLVPRPSIKITNKTVYPSAMQIQDIIYGLPYDVSPLTLDDSALSGVKYTRKITVEDFFERYIPVKNIELLEDFMFSMLQFDCRHRKSAGLLLEHEYLSSRRRLVDLSRSITESTNMIVENCPPEQINTENRHLINELIFELYLTEDKYAWYHHKILFTSINLMDRLCVANKAFASLGKKDYQSYFKACVYIISKYYASHYACDLLYQHFPFKKLSPKSLDKAKIFEDTVLETVKYRIYEVSPYDIMMDEESPSEAKTFSLLLYVLDGRHFGLTPEQTYKNWKTGQTKLIRNARKHEVYKEKHKI